MALNEAHGIAEQVTAKIQNEMGMYATVHVDPMSKKTKLHDQVEKSIKVYCQENNLCNSFHELRVIEKEGNVRLTFDLQIKQEISRKSKKAIREEITGRLKKQFPHIIKHVKIEFDPLFALET